MLWLVLSLLGATVLCAYLGTRLLTWSITCAAILMAFTVLGSIHWGLIGLGWLLLLAITIPLNMPVLRQQYLTRHMLDAYLKMTPKLSATEQIALDAGTVGWEGELFTGRPKWKQLLKRRTPELTLEERAFLDDQCEKLCSMLDEWQICHVDADMSPETWEYMKKERFFGMIIPTEYGGLGFSALAHRAVLQKVGGLSAVAGSTVAVPNSLGPAELLLHYGTEEQKNYYLPKLAVGEEIPCFGLTGPTAGSDATSIPDKGIVCMGEWNGKQVLGMRLTFDKRYITLAPVATVVGLAFRLYDPEGLLGDVEDIGISLALIPRDTEGVEIGRRHLPLNSPFMNGPIRGENVFVPIDTLIGGPEMAGQGWRMLVECLSVGRAISLPSNNTGGAKLATLATGAYARIRQQFNMPIGRFEGVEEAMARMAGRTYAASALSKMTAIAVDQGEKPSVPSAIAKYHATEKARQVVSDAMDVHAGKGVILGPRNYLGRAWQVAPMSITVEGANILTRSMMIFGQGAIRCHPYVLKELQAAQLTDPSERLKTFDDLLFKHIGHTIGNACRAFFMGFGTGRFSAVPSDRKTGRYYRKLSRYAAAFGLIADVSMLTFGGKLKQKERISARLGDVLSQLYIGSAMLKRFEDQGRPAADQPILAWAFYDCVYQIQEALRGVLDNFPNKVLATALKVIIFPLGARERRPNDRLGHRVASLLIAPSETRDRLTDGVYKTASPGYVIGAMEALLPEVIAAEPLARKLDKAVRQGAITGDTYEQRIKQAIQAKLLSKKEAKLLLDVNQRTMEIIAVDDFNDDELRASTSELLDKVSRRKAA